MRWATHMIQSLSRDAAWALLTEWTAGESLRKHALAVEAAVRGYARTFGEDETAWGRAAHRVSPAVTALPGLTDAAVASAPTFAQLGPDRCGTTV